MLSPINAGKRISAFVSVKTKANITSNNSSLIFFTSLDS
jgi:hypothetical protein